MSIFPVAFLVALLLLHQFAYSLRIMTFNTWLSGTKVENGLHKIAKHIALLQPDIVALQEIASPEVLKNLTAVLEAPWKAAIPPGVSHPDTAILTRHKFVEGRSLIVYYAPSVSGPSTNLYGVGASVQMLNPPGHVVNFFSMHLDYTSYGPYAANNKQVTRSEQIMAGERSKGGWGRAQNIEELLADEQFQRFAKRSNKEPLIVAGDFNCPSHQDWIEETKHLHGGWTFEWPATKLLTDFGLIDAFREVHLNVTESPGFTWSTIWKFDGPEWDWLIPEPQDRIDFVFYKSAELKPTAAISYCGTEPLKPMPHPWTNDWPSDHYASVVEFSWE